MRISIILNDLLNLYFWVIVVRIFLTWIPSIDWYKPPASILAAVSDIVLKPFQRLIPAFGGIDFSPIIALFAFQFIQYALVKFLFSYGL